MSYIVFGICAVAVVAAIAYVLIVYTRKRRLNDFAYINEKKVEMLSLAEVVKFFKQPTILEKIKERNGSVAVALRQKGEAKRVRIVLCTFDKRTDEVGQPLGVYSVGCLDAPLADAFGEKDMVIFQ